MAPARSTSPKDSTSQRLFAIALLLTLGVLLVAAGVALALAEGSGLASAIIGSVVALVFFVVLLRTDVELLIRILRGLQLLGPVVAFSLTTILMGKTAGTLSFDEVGAQVVIVLLLALAIDARFFRLRASNDGLDVVTICFTMVLLAVGEFYALKGLLTGQPARAEMVAGAIAAGFTAVAITALTGGGRPGGDGPLKDIGPPSDVPRDRDDSSTASRSRRSPSA